MEQAQGGCAQNHEVRVRLSHPLIEGHDTDAVGEQKSSGSESLNLELACSCCFRAAPIVRPPGKMHPGKKVSEALLSFPIIFALLFEPRADTAAVGMRHEMERACFRASSSAEKLGNVSRLIVMAVRNMASLLGCGGG